MTLCSFLLKYKEESLVYLRLMILSPSVSTSEERWAILMNQPSRLLYYETFSTPWGDGLTLMSHQGLVFIALSEENSCLSTVLNTQAPWAQPVRLGSLQADWAQTLKKWLFQRQTVLAVPIDVDGTPFQHAVWQAIGEIPYGQTRTYTKVAECIGRPNAVRAVASACGKNPLAVVVPCHRVLGKGAQLRGFRWGLHLKNRLLEEERG